MEAFAATGLEFAGTVGAEAAEEPEELAKVLELALEEVVELAPK